MVNYTKPYRTLDCWKCFLAQGKICSSLNNKSMFLYTGSTNPGNAICCRPNYFEGVCGGKNGEY
jgi:hypothetical protein